MRALSPFFIAHGGASMALGVHLVLLAWLSVSYLQLTPAEIGWVQAAALIPSVFSVLLAGVWADRYSPITIIACAYFILVCAYLGLGAAVHFQFLSFRGLLLYGVVAGIGNAVVQPVREKLVGQFSESELQKRISTTSIIQFTCQSAGIILASFSDDIGVWLVSLVQVCVISIAICSILVLSPSLIVPARVLNKQQKFWRALACTVKQFVKDSALKQLLILVAFNGYMHMGVFIVVMPLIARDLYQLSSLQYGMLQLVFVVGMVTAHWRLLLRSKVNHPGQGALFCLLYTSVIGIALAKQPTLQGFYLLVLFWGWVAGYSAAHCRLVLQSRSNHEHRGKMMSVYQFVLFGMAPLGALATGYCLRFFSSGEILWVMGLSSGCLFFVFLIFRSLWAVEQI